MKPPPYCSSLQDGGGFLCLRFFGWCGSALGSVLGADALAGFGVCSLGLECARWVWKVGEASPEPVGWGWWQQLRLHRTTRAGECPLCGAGRLEDGAPAPRARYAPRAVSATHPERLRSPRASDGELRRLQFRLVLVGDGSEPA